MPQKQTKPAAKELIVEMSQHLSTSKIAYATAKSLRTIQRILADSHNGIPFDKPSTQGRHRALNNLDLNVGAHTLLYSSCYILSPTTQLLQGHIELKPDLYLSELQQILKDAHGVEVSESTIHRALHRRGYSYKKASLISFCGGSGATVAT